MFPKPGFRIRIDIKIGSRYLVFVVTESRTSRLLRLTCVIICLSLPLVAFGQGGVEKRFNFGSQDYGFVVTGSSTDGTPIAAPDQKLSGTNVRIDVNVGSGWAPAGTPGTENVTDAVLENVKIFS